ncbi:MAG: AMP-binding protein [Propionivibrio sp.]
MSPDIDRMMESAGWTVPGLLDVRQALSPEEAALWQWSNESRWVKTTWSDYRRSVGSLARGFGKLGLATGERVGIMAASCKEWDFSQLGILAAGGVAIGLDAHGLDEHAQDIALRCNLVGMVVDDLSSLAKLGDEARGKLRFVVSLKPDSAPDVVTLDHLLVDEEPDVEWNQAQPDAIATIIFTSGTTGAPKGIAYSHRQMCLATAAILSAFPEISDGSRLACWLPLSNLFQRMINLCAIGCGAQTFYVSDPREIMRFVPQIAPHVFIGVPRFFEKLHAGIEEAMAKKPAWQQQIAQWAFRVGDQHARAARSGQGPGWLLGLQRAIAERMVLRKLRVILGNNLRFLISGSAPMPLWLLERFHAMGLPVLEAYGLSENIIPVALNRPGRFRFGTVGHPLPGCEVRLAHDGELQVRGPGVFSGYFGEDTTEARIDDEGFLTSGDFASIDADGFITLVGRKAEIFKTSTGRRVAPASIESLLGQIKHVEYAAVFGAGRTQPIALIVMDKVVWQENPQRFCQRLRNEAAIALAPLPPYLRPAGAAITDRTFTIAGGELTANLKMRRRNIETNYAPLLLDLESQLDKAAGGTFESQSADTHALLISL